MSKNKHDVFLLGFKTVCRPTTTWSLPRRKIKFDQIENIYNHK